MPTTVYFATNRAVTNPADAVHGYPALMVPPSAPEQMTYGTAFIDEVNVATNAQGVVSEIGETRKGGFPQQANDDLLHAGRDLFVFIHGFDNSFSDAVTRAAFNREWMAASRLPGTNTAVIAFSWPSEGGTVVGFPIPDSRYKADQAMARASDLHLMTFLANLGPILRSARANGYRVTLIAHSMGNLALEGAVESWFLHESGSDQLFDLAILAAGDCGYDTFDQPKLARMSGLIRLAGRVSVYYSHADDVLKLSQVINLVPNGLGKMGLVTVRIRMRFHRLNITWRTVRIIETMHSISSRLISTTDSHPRSARSLRMKWEGRGLPDSAP